MSVIVIVSLLVDETGVRSGKILYLTLGAQPVLYLLDVFESEAFVVVMLIFDQYQAVVQVREVFHKTC